MRKTKKTARQRLTSILESRGKENIDSWIDNQNLGGMTCSEILRTFNIGKSQLYNSKPSLIAGFGIFFGLTNYELDIIKTTNNDAMIDLIKYAKDGSIVVIPEGCEWDDKIVKKVGIFTKLCNLIKFILNYKYNPSNGWCMLLEMLLLIGMVAFFPLLDYWLN